MKVRVLGCSGGIGSRAGTTSFLVDDDVLIDAGTGVEALSLAQLARIDHVFLSHSHLDHVVGLPLMIDSTGARRDRPLVAYGLPETLQALRTHIFNEVIWPDFTRIPSAHRPWLRFQPIALGQSIELGGRTIGCLPAQHTVAALAFALRGPGGSWVFSGDTGPCDAFWDQVNALPDLRALVIETAFPNEDRSVAEAARHLYPEQLAALLARLRVPAQVWITHLKPSDADTIVKQIGLAVGHPSPRILRDGDEFEL